MHTPIKFNFNAHAFILKTKVYFFQTLIYLIYTSWYFLIFIKNNNVIVKII